MPVSAFNAILRSLNRRIKHSLLFAVNTILNRQCGRTITAMIAAFVILLQAVNIHWIDSISGFCTTRCTRWTSKTRSKSDNNSAWSKHSSEQKWNLNELLCCSHSTVCILGGCVTRSQNSNLFSSDLKLIQLVKCPELSA